MTKLLDYLPENVSIEDIESNVREFTKNYRIEKGTGPSGTETEAYRRSLVLAHIPLGVLVRRAVELGDPNSFRARDVNKREFDALIEELNRREQFFMMQEGGQNVVAT